MEKKLSLLFGVIGHEPIEQQLTEQGFDFCPEEISHLETGAQAVNQLRALGLLTRHAAWETRQRIFHRVADHLCKRNDMEVSFQSINDVPDNRIQLPENI